MINNSGIDVSYTCETTKGMLKGVKVYLERIIEHLDPGNKCGLRDSFYMVGTESFIIDDLSSTDGESFLYNWKDLPNVDVSDDIRDIRIGYYGDLSYDWYIRCEKDRDGTWSVDVRSKCTSDILREEELEKQSRPKQDQFTPLVVHSVDRMDQEPIDLQKLVDLLSVETAGEEDFFKIVEYFGSRYMSGNEIGAYSFFKFANAFAVALKNFNINDSYVKSKLFNDLESIVKSILVKIE